MSCLIILCPIYLRQDLLLNLVFMDLASLAGQPDPLVSYVPMWNYAWILHAWWGSKLGTAHLYDKCSYLLIHLPSQLTLE